MYFVMSLLTYFINGRCTREYNKCYSFEILAYNVILVNKDYVKDDCLLVTVTNSNWRNINQTYDVFKVYFQKKCLLKINETYDF